MSEKNIDYKETDDLEIKLQAALNDDRNKTLMDTSLEEISSIKRGVLETIPFALSSDRHDVFNKLSEYVYIDQMNDFKPGAYLRWIALTDATITKKSLRRGAFFCNIQIGIDECFVVCQMGGRYIQFPMDECVVFQKLTQMEQLILDAFTVIST